MGKSFTVIEGSSLFQVDILPKLCYQIPYIPLRYCMIQLKVKRIYFILASNKLHSSRAEHDKEASQYTYVSLKASDTCRTDVYGRAGSRATGGLVLSV